ncbi:MAG: hypothetical protein ACJAQT_000289 [Akkermansiaceae bacterium]|jgi:hypothetical protein
MHFPLTTSILTGLFALGVAVVGAQETPLEKAQRENRHLNLQLANINKSLAASLAREETKTKSLRKIREYHALFGIDIFEGGDSKLLHAATDYQIAREDLNNLEAAVSNLIPLIQNYLRTALGSDPEARRAVEVKIRELEVALGLRQQPKRKIEQGTAQEARIVTVDSSTGVGVINAGSDAELSVGTRFRIERSGTHICDAVVAVVRPNVSGLLMLSLTNPEVSVQPGDFAKIITFIPDPTN